MEERHTGGRAYALRLAGWEDVDLLFSWANEREVRRYSFSQEPIGYEEHCAWFKEKMQDKDSQIYIFCEEKQEKGMLRLDFCGNTVEISYSIAPEERQKGYGKELILLAEKEICQRFQRMKRDLPDMGQACHIVVIKARVKEGNLASNRIFTKLGYEKCKGGYEKRRKVGRG